MIDFSSSVLYCIIYKHNFHKPFVNINFIYTITNERLALYFRTIVKIYRLRNAELGFNPGLASYSNNRPYVEPTKK